MSGAGALDGIRVLDAGLLMQGPLAGQVLSDLGADVIKVEMPGVGDISRFVPVSAKDRRAPWFIACNRGKRSLTLDLRQARGADIFLSLCDGADVVVSNFVPGTMDRWGLGYEAIAARNPAIVYASGSTFGAVGSRARAEGLDVVAQAASGLSTTTDEGGPVGVTIADHVAGLNLTIGILAALVARAVTGAGQHVTTSLLGGMVAAQAPEMTAHLLSGEPVGPPRKGHPLIPTVYGVFTTADGGVAIARVPEGRRAAFWAAVGLKDVARNPQLTGRLSAERKSELFALLDDALAKRDTAHWCAVFDQLGVVHAAVRTYRDVAADPEVFANGYLTTVEHPTWGAVTMPGSAIGLSATPVRPGQLAPRLGEHTASVLGELGLGEAEIADLQREGVV